MPYFDKALVCFVKFPKRNLFAISKTFTAKNRSVISGLKGTTASPPQFAHTAVCICLEALMASFLAALQSRTGLAVLKAFLRVIFFTCGETNSFQSCRLAFCLRTFFSLTFKISSPRPDLHRFLVFFRHSTYISYVGCIKILYGLRALLFFIGTF